MIRPGELDVQCRMWMMVIQSQYMSRTRPMDLRALKYVAEAARLGSITKAAARLHVAQPALSRQIRLLEEELGVILLLRHRRGVRPTKEGLDFVRSAEVLLRMAQQIRDD